MIKNFAQLIKKVIKKKMPIILDVGANSGQSIEFFRKLYRNPTIHSFEPIKEEFLKLEKKYDNICYLNNFACGDKNTTRVFYQTKGTANSSFLKITPNTKWLRERARYWNTISKNFVTKKSKIKIITLDSYCKKNKLNFIDILKIDTEGYEENVLIGSKNLLKKNKIKLIVTELGLSNHYLESASFINLERHLIKNNFILHAIQVNNKFLSRLNEDLGCDLIYVNEKA